MKCHLNKLDIYRAARFFSTRFFYKHTSFLLKSTINELACLVLPFSAAPTVNFDFTSHCRAPFLTGLVNPPWNPHFISPDEIPLKPNSLRRFLWLKGRKFNIYSGISVSVSEVYRNVYLPYKIRWHFVSIPGPVIKCLHIKLQRFSPILSTFIGSVTIVFFF